ncbi:uncharacterized GPI-anchored protein At1g61900 isoform X2 [Physcomitrium patens]|uniref:uncharacterized GPI-anchored protein At1g61900 isoform X2 n=1 Tax=Physcomitrium patens TaxID=3218 RepID=UPI000D17D1EF|nr:uncharacterized GPI-anchored protein At1g61900-like isoform X3 [Physcomitrium patens]|eukprot:XP_024391863.1 uncharacterized GPI-anchored protein At1g61900-like isoform X3 [Physcomitrella patens]
MKGMKGWRSGLRRPQMSTLLLLYVGLLCQLRGTFSIGHQHGNPIEVGQQLIQDSSPTPSKLPTPSPPTFDTPTPFPTASPPVQASSGIFPFMAPPPLEIPVITNPSTPELSGFCPFDFSTLEGTLIRTAGDCPAPLALYVGSVICCPQLESLFQVSLGQYSLDSGNLGLNVTEAEYCFSDTQNLMASLGANTSLGDLCAAQPANLTSGLCPVTKVSQLEEMINTTKLLDACHSVDPLKECTEEPTCQSQVMDVATQMAGQLVGDPGQLNGSAVPPGEQQVVVDCKNMVLAWLASKLGPDAANTMLRNLISCRVNKDIYSLCGIDLKDFSLQGVGGQGCLLSSLPSDIMSNVTGIDFTCDLNDNIAAPWVQTLKTDAAYSVCGRPPVALPAIPESSTASWSIDFRRRNFLIMALCVVFIISKL